MEPDERKRVCKVCGPLPLRHFNVYVAYVRDGKEQLVYACKTCAKTKRADKYAAAQKLRTDPEEAKRQAAEKARIKSDLQKLEAVLGPFRVCKKCGPLPLDRFRKRVAYVYNGKDVHKYICLSCENRRNSEQAKKDPKRAVQWKKDHPDRIRVVQKDWLDAVPGRREKFRQKGRDRRSQVRLDVIRHYSNGTMTCSCCNDGTVDFLCIDHIAGGGNAHRRVLKRKSGRFFLWLIQEKYPEGFRVLCHNCNHAFSKLGRCPHQDVATPEVRAVESWRSVTGDDHGEIDMFRT
jgi:hypothetical protein